MGWHCINKRAGVFLLFAVVWLIVGICILAAPAHLFPPVTPPDPCHKNGDTCSRCSKIDCSQSQTCHSFAWNSTDWCLCTGTGPTCFYSGPPPTPGPCDQCLIGGVLTAVGTILLVSASLVAIYQCTRDLRGPLINVWTKGALALVFLPCAFRGLLVEQLPMVSEQTNFTWQGVVGVAAFNAFLPPGVIFFLMFQTEVFHQRWGRPARATVLACCAVLEIAVVVTSMKYFVQPSNIVGALPSNSDAWGVFAGMILVIVFLALAVLSLLLALRAAFVRVEERNGLNESSPLLMRSIDASINGSTTSLLSGVGTFQPRPWLRVFGPMLFYVGFLPLLWLACIVFPPIWNVPFGEGGYNYASSVLAWNFLIFKIQTGKFYTDQLLWFGFIYFMFLASLILYSPRLSRLMHRRYRLIVPFTTMWHTPSVGETIVCLLVGGFMIVWYIYWIAFYLDPFSASVGRIRELPIWQRLSRAQGHMTNLLLSFLILPVARNSLWEMVFGIPFDRAIRYHRWLGNATVVSLTLHVFFWWGWFIQQGLFPHDIYSITPAINPADPHIDNFLMGILHLTWLGVVCMWVFSWPYFRRKHFEMFYYVHQFAYVAIIVALTHAWALWNFLGGGLCLYLLDRMIRVSRAAWPVVVTSIEPTGDGLHTIVHLQFAYSPMRYRAGQYAFLQIPALSGLQWHPFSISSAPGDSRVTFHIKDMGQGSWTHELKELARYQQGVGSRLDRRPPPHISVDGPYGNPLEANNYSVVVLIAGGIGITPLHSIYRDLYNQVQFGRAPQLRRVYLHWSVRDTLMIDSMFRDTFQSVCTNNPGDIFKQQFYITRVALAESRNQRYNTVEGRINTELIFRDLHAAHRTEALDGRVSTFVCGPEELVQATSASALKYGFDFHKEIFLL